MASIVNNLQILRKLIFFQDFDPYPQNILKKLLRNVMSKLKSLNL